VSLINPSVYSRSFLVRY